MPSPQAPATALIVHSHDPLNAEPPLARLRASFVTPVADFYIRSHGAIPAIAPADYRLEVAGQGEASHTLTLDALRQRFASRSVMAVMQCAGNRRADLQQVESTSGDPWAPGAIGNAEWTGVALADVLRAAGADLAADRHVVLRALDIARNEGAADAPYEVSIPVVKALDPDVLLAWAMNGAPLTPEHGAPLRVVVPGYAGVRSPKWIGSISVRDTPAASFQQAHDYLLFPPDMRKATEDVARGITIDAMPLNAAICEPADGATLPVGETLVRGYAIATDRAIVRVDVSVNGGRAWQQAALEDHGTSRWSWTLWSARLPLPPGTHEVVVRAWDAAGQTQPARPDDTWNFKGYLSAAWHRVRVTAG